MVLKFLRLLWSASKVLMGENTSNEGANRPHTDHEIACG